MRKSCCWTGNAGNWHASWCLPVQPWNPASTECSSPCAAVAPSRFCLWGFRNMLIWAAKAGGSRQSDCVCQVRVGSMELGWWVSQLWLCFCFAVTQLLSSKIGGQIPLILRPRKFRGARESACFCLLLDCKLFEDSGVEFLFFHCTQHSVLPGGQVAWFKACSSLAASLTCFLAYSQVSSWGSKQATGHQYPRISGETIPKVSFSLVSGEGWRGQSLLFLGPWCKRWHFIMPRRLTLEICCLQDFHLVGRTPPELRHMVLIWWLLTEGRPSALYWFTSVTEPLIAWLVCSWGLGENVQQIQKHEQAKTEP